GPRTWGSRNAWHALPPRTSPTGDAWVRCWAWQHFLGRSARTRWTLSSPEPPRNTAVPWCSDVCSSDLPPMWTRSVLMMSTWSRCESQCPEDGPFRKRTHRLVLPRTARRPGHPRIRPADPSPPRHHKGMTPRGGLVPPPTPMGRKAYAFSVPLAVRRSQPPRWVITAEQPIERVRRPRGHRRADKRDFCRNAPGQRLRPHRLLGGLVRALPPVRTGLPAVLGDPHRHRARQGGHRGTAGAGLRVQDPVHPDPDDRA